MNENAPERIVVVGGGHGGANVVALLRQHSYAGEIVFIGEETDPPYHRPPLSKAYLKGDVPLDELWIKPSDFYREQDISTRFGTRVTAVHAATREVELDGGERIEYDALVLATGAVPRRLELPGISLSGVHELRSKGHADRLGELLRPGRRIVIVGGGYIGLEVAASARHLGAEVVVLEREDRALARVASPELAEHLVGFHQSHGNEIVVAAEVVGIGEGKPGEVGSVLLADRPPLDCDVVLIGAGALPCDGLAAGAGIACSNGIEVDDQARTNVPGIYAVGDVTCRPLAGMEGTFRLESIPSAVEQAKQAVSSILSDSPPRAEVPWFWSDQFDAKIKIAGLFRDIDHTVVRGDRTTGKFGIFHFRGECVVAVEAVNSSADFMAGKKLILSGTPVDASLLADSAVSLREVAA